MNPLRRFSITFDIIVLLGGLLFIRQTRRLGEVRRHVVSLPNMAQIELPSPGETSVTDKPAGKSQADTDAEEKLIAKLKAALAASLTEEQLTAFLSMGGTGVTFESVAASAHLTPEESSHIREELGKYDKERAALYLNHDLTPAALDVGLAGLKLRQDKWLAGQLGTERYARMIRDEDRRNRASAKQRAAESVSRIGSATDLTEEQKKKKLNDGFLKINLDSPRKAAENKLVVETTGSLEMAPSAPDLSQEAEKILTPGQLEDYQHQQEASTENTKARSEAMMGMMESLLPAVIKLLENHD